MVQKDGLAGFGFGQFTACAVPPVVAVKLMALGETTRRPVLLTYMVTGICRGLLGAATPDAVLVAVIEMVPVHVVPAAMPPGFADTVKLPSVLPLVASVKVSHELPHAALLA